MYRFGSGMFLVNPFVYAGGAPAPSYLVDDYSPEVAFSLRKLSSSATVAIRVRRSSDNSETDIGFSGDDLDTASLSSFCSGTNGHVVKWYNQGTSGSTNDLSQTAVANQPNIFFSGSVRVNADGFKSLGFASPQKLTGSAISGLGSDMSTFGVAQGFASANYTLWSDMSTSSNLILQRLDCSTGTTSLVVGNGTGSYWWTDTSSGLTAGRVYLISNFIDNSKNMSGYIDNSALTGATYTGSFNASAGFAIGVQGSSSLYLTGYVTELIIFNTDESANRTEIESNINGHYGIY